MHTSIGPRISLFSLLLAALLAFPSLAPAQANAAYTADYPTVDRVKAEIKGSTPTDTLARQVGVLTYLSEEIKRIAYNRSVRTPALPEEVRLMTAYNLAAYQISESFKKSHTPAEFADFDRLQFNYMLDRDFRKDWTKRLIGAQGQAAYSGTTAELAARQQAHVENIKRQNEEAEAAAKRTANSRNADGLSNDPTAVTTRRCLELGGGPLTCLGKGMSAGMLGLIGFNPESITGPGPAGVILSGSYNSRSTGLQFNSGSVAISSCGKLVPDGHKYTIAKAPGSLLLHVDSQPQNITLAMRPDGGLTGPGLIDVAGRIIIGYHTITHTLYVNGYPATGAQCNGPCSTTESIPDYAPKTERCTIGSYSPPAPVTNASTAPAMSDGFSAMANLITGGVAHADAPPSLPGLRMIGQFTGNGLSLLFDAGNVIVDCGPAHVRATYTVHNQPNALVVNVENPSSPFTLTVAPDSTLRGSGTTTVNGKLVSGMQGNDVTFRPVSNTCPLDSLQPKAGSPGTTKVAAGAGGTPTDTPAAPAAATPAQPSALTHTSSSAASSASGASTTSISPAASTETGSARVTISTAYPPGSNPPANQTVSVLRESFEVALRKAGAPLPANITATQAMASYAVNCRPPRDCTAINNGMRPYYAGRATLGPDGKGTVTPNIAPGDYYLSTAARTSQGIYVWNIPIHIKPGDNTITLDPHTAELLPLAPTTAQ